jgi:hypothetical protein
MIGSSGSGSSIGASVRLLTVKGVNPIPSSNSVSKSRCVMDAHLDFETEA